MSQTPTNAPENTPEGVASTAATVEEMPWADGEFDAEKAWNLIKNLRADKDKLAARPVLTDEAQQQLSEYQRIVEANRTDAERAQQELARWQEDAQRWRSTAVSARIQALAATDFADPTDAVAALDPSKYLDAGGQINEAAIQADLSEILNSKPHWRRTPDGSTTAPRVPAPNPAQGAGGGITHAATGSSDPAQQFAALLQAQMRAR